MTSFITSITPGVVALLLAAAAWLKAKAAHARIDRLPPAAPPSNVKITPGGSL
jgi:hypothetical protein